MFIRIDRIPLRKTEISFRTNYFDAEKMSPNKLGRALNSYKFNFKHRVVNGLSEYWLKEK